MAIPAMTKNEILDGEIIRQNGIKNVLEEFGFKENKDFIFIPERQGVYYPFENGKQGSLSGFRAVDCSFVKSL